MRALHWLKTSNILYADIHIEDGNITCDDNDNNNDNNDDDNTTTNEEDEQQQQQQGTVTTHSCKGYVVRKPKIMRALHWLKTSNILYADIHIEDGNITCDDNDNNNDNNDDDNTTTNEEDEQQQQQQGTVNGPPQLESSVVRTDFNMPNTEAVDIIRNGDFNYPVYRLPRAEGQSISLFTDAKAEEMAFPCLFPNGVNGFLTARDPAISITDYIQIRLLVDGLVTFPIYCGHVISLSNTDCVMQFALL